MDDHLPLPPPASDRLEAALAAWGRAARLGDRLGGGNRNLVHAVSLGDAVAVLRWSRREEPALAWELDLLEMLARAGLRVPRPVPTPDGRRAVAGCVVLTWLDGEPPAGERDWRAVAATLTRLHHLTRAWPQRPGFAGTSELLNTSGGGDVRLDLMPPVAVARCRAAWRLLAGEPRAVVHGDPGAANIRISREGVGLLDWDEARVDVILLDLAQLPLDLAGERDAPGGELTRERLAAALLAADAWEAANGWLVEPVYARRRLNDLIDRLPGPDAGATAAGGG